MSSTRCENLSLRRGHILLSARALEPSFDSLFLRSGFLLAHLMLKELQNRGPNPLLAILLRCARL